MSSNGATVQIEPSKDTSNPENAVKSVPILPPQGPTKVPPDGGWGWMIVIAYAVANMITIPVMLSFGLIYKNKLPDMGLSATDVSLIMNTFSSFAMSLGLINGPLIKTYGYRKVGVASGIFFSLGMFLTTWANGFTHFMITYSLIAAIGMGMATSAFSFALNSYFRKKRNRAVGLAATLTGLGPIVVPQLTSHLLDNYGSKGCVMILSAISLHIIGAGLLLQPIKWHLVDVAPPPPKEIELQPINEPIPEEEEEITEDERSTFDQTVVAISEERNGHNGFSDFSSEDEDGYLDNLMSIDHEIEAQNIYGLEFTPAISIQRLNSQCDQSLANFQSKQDLTFNPQLSHDSSSGMRYRRQSSTMSNRSQRPNYMRSLSHLSNQKTRRWFEDSHETINLGSSMNIFNEKPDEKKVMIREPSRYSIFPAGSAKITEEATKIERSLPPVPQKSALKKTQSVVEEPMEQHHHHKHKRTVSYQLRKTAKVLVNLFDLDLLRDAKYLNLMLGMSVAIFAEINFSVLTPFILNDMEYSTDQIASVMSALALTDLIFRFLAPYIGEALKQPPRIMYMISLVLLIITRSFVYAVSSYTGMIVVGILLGIAKGIRTVYMSLVIPDYIPIERLANASGIQMVTNGVFLMAAGPMLGWVRDITGSYHHCVVIINLVTLLALLMWTTEMLYVRYRNKKT